MGKLEQAKVKMITSFRSELREWVECNTERLQNMRFFKQLSSNLNCRKRKLSRDGIQERDRILDQIFRSGRNYDTGCERDDWLETSFIVPLIMMKFNISKVYVFEVSESIESTIMIQNERVDFQLQRDRFGLQLPREVCHESTIYLVHYQGSHFMYLHPYDKRK